VDGTGPDQGAFRQTSIFPPSTVQGIASGTSFGSSFFPFIEDYPDVITCNCTDRAGVAGGNGNIRRDFFGVWLYRPTISSIPEPNTTGMIAAMLGALLVFRRSKGIRL
jgi:hypothetical protein